MCGYCVPAYPPSFCFFCEIVSRRAALIPVERTIFGILYKNDQHTSGKTENIFAAVSGDVFLREWASKYPYHWDSRDYFLAVQKRNPLYNPSPCESVYIKCPKVGHHSAALKPFRRARLFYVMVQYMVNYWRLDPFLPPL